MEWAYLVLTLVSVLNFATPLLLAATGELVVEKSGVLNLGVEGMMIVGAMTAYFVGAHIDLEVCTVPHFSGVGCLVGTSSIPMERFAIVVLTRGLAGMALSFLFALLVLGFRSNQVATGLGLTLLGLTLTNALGSGSGDLKVGRVDTLLGTQASDWGIWGPLLNMNPMVWLTIILCLTVGWILTHTLLGLIIRAVGENHDSAHTLGLPVQWVRLGAIVFGGLCAGMAGAYISMIQIGAPLWKEGITAGAGWLALALILFATWRAERVVLGALIFGFTLALELRLQTLAGLPSWFVPWLLPSLPYLIPIIVLTLISLDARVIRRNAPASLGKLFEPIS